MVGFILALILCYQLAFSKTFQLKAEFDRLQRQRMVFENLPTKLNLLNKKEKYLDSVLSLKQIIETSVQNNILKAIDEYAVNNKLIVSQFDNPIRSNKVT